MKESDLYPRVEQWMKKHFRCFATATNTGLAYSRPDVTGVRDIGGDLSGEVESIIIEVKRGDSQPFATASGQALGYRVYANRVYLADDLSSKMRTGKIGLVELAGFFEVEG
jgi:hypothetical protein